MRLNILSLPPPLADNPYQRLLYDGLSRHGVTLLEGRTFDRGALSPDSRDACRFLHVHWIWLKSGVLARVARWCRARRYLALARRQGWRIAWTAHNLDPHEGDRLDADLTRWLARHADVVFVHTHWAGSELARRFGRTRRVHVIPHGHYRDVMAEAAPREAARRDLEMPADSVVLLAFGQVRPYKGLEELIGAVRGRSEPRLRLLIAGQPRDPAYRDHLVALAASDARIRLDLAFVPEERIPVYFGAADWAVLPYRRITTSGTLVLALGFGVPVVIPDHPALVETAGAAALTYPRELGVGDGVARALAEDPARFARATPNIVAQWHWDPIAIATRDALLEACHDPS